MILVSSGAIAVGRRHLGLAAGTLRLEEKQAAAATGQIRLAHAYQEALARHGITVAQVLLTLDDTEDRRRHLNARATLATLLKLRRRAGHQRERHRGHLGDPLRRQRPPGRPGRRHDRAPMPWCCSPTSTGSTAPIRSCDPAARHIPLIEDLSPEIEAMGGEALPGYSSGGMVTKLAAARIAIGAGCRMAIADGLRLNPLKAMAQGARCSWFIPAGSPLTARKKWIAGALKPVGSLTVDDGALKALSGGKSLLPAGVVAVEGHFERGDAVRVLDRTGPRGGARPLGLFGRRCPRIMGHKSREIEALLGYRGRDEMIHRDDLVVER